MALCEQARTAHAYHDGELAPEARRRFETHLAACPRCRGELEWLRSCSRRLAPGAVPVLTDEMRARLHQRLRRLGERALFRTAAALTAAAVLLVCGVLLWGRVEGPGTPEGTVADWERVAVAPGSEPAPGADADLGQWILQDLSRENGHD